MARKEAALQEMQIEGFSEKEYAMVRLENVGDALFQVPLLDDVNLEMGKMYARFYTFFVR